MAVVVAERTVLELCELEPFATYRNVRFLAVMAQPAAQRHVILHYQSATNRDVDIRPKIRVPAIAIRELGRHMPL